MVNDLIGGARRWLPLHASPRRWSSDKGGGEIEDRDASEEARDIGLEEGKVLARGSW